MISIRAPPAICSAHHDVCRGTRRQHRKWPKNSRATTAAGPNSAQRCSAKKSKRWFVDRDDQRVDCDSVRCLILADADRKKRHLVPRPGACAVGNVNLPDPANAADGETSAEVNIKAKHQ